MDAKQILTAEEVVAAVRSEQERAVTTAYEREAAIVATIRSIRSKWVELAEQLYEFQVSRAWETLGYDTLETWLASPDIEMSRRMFFALTEAFRELVIERGVLPAQLGNVDMTKAMDVLPAVRRGQVDVQTALADCEVLTRTDLRERYQSVPPLQAEDIDAQPIVPDTFHYENCPSCGSRIKVTDE